MFVIDAYGLVCFVVLSWCVMLCVVLFGFVWLSLVRFRSVRVVSIGVLCGVLFCVDVCCVLWCVWCCVCAWCVLR